MELIFKLFSFDATVICPNANCREKVHGVVLIYGIILLLTAILCFQRSNYRIPGVAVICLLLFRAILTLLHAPFKA